MYAQPNYGWIEVVTGPMYSGKTTEITRRVRHELRVGKKVVLLRVEMDNALEPLMVHVGGREVLRSTAVSRASQIAALVPDDAEVVVVDEAQFLDRKALPLLADLAAHGKRVIVAGLDTDFRGFSFGHIGSLLAEAEQVDKLFAICAQCGGRATRTQRLVQGRPAAEEDPTIETGGDVEYEPRCRACHMLPVADQDL